MWTAFPLHPETPEEGRDLEEMYSDRQYDLKEMMAHMKGVADAEGLPLGVRKKTYNSRLAQELGKWAESQGRGDAFHDAAFRSYFAAGKNIGKIPELVELAESVGLPGDEAHKVLETRAFKDVVDRDWLRCRRFGITAVPTFVIGNQALVGAQPYEMMAEFLETNGVKRRAVAP